MELPGFTSSCGSFKMQQIFISSFCLFSVMTFFKVAVACQESKCGDDGLAINLPLHRGDDEYWFVLVKFFVKHIDYIRQEIQLHTPDKCLLLTDLDNSMDMPTSPFHWDYQTDNFTLFRCPDKRVVDFAFLVSCLGNRTAYAIESYVSLGGILPLESCTKMYDVLELPTLYAAESYNHLRWSKPNCSNCKAMGRKCRLKNIDTQSEIHCVHSGKPSATPKLVAAGSTLGSFLILLPAFAGYRFYTWDRNKKEHQSKVEKFLEDYRTLKPRKYSYANIKRITNEFKDKLGEGSFGTVFRGNLSTKFFVAVKVLNGSKGDGEEFINEVAAMGRIHRVNVVRLVGFCADGFKRALVYDVVRLVGFCTDGFKRALVYEYFPNGSLQEFISSAYNKKSFLGWDKMHDISLGIAIGIEYLHEGCVQRILHFDIKPHNVLLDQNFILKISDFGLAKLCSKEQSIVSMTTTRGIMGYIEPEAFSRNFINVSYKSDVYSFGVLLLEIVGKRKNIGLTMDSSSGVYYPEWIYKNLRVCVGEEGSMLELQSN